jgi:AbrB family looped-hinge helix DNA binding protein
VGVLTKLRTRVRVGKRGVIVIPKNIREKLGIVEGMFLELSVEDNKIILETRDLWNELRMRGRKLNLNVDIDKAEEELDEDEKEWLKRLKL